MGEFFIKVLKGTFKVHSAKKRKKTKQESVRQRPGGHLPYYGWSWQQVVGLTAREAERQIKRDCPGVYCQVVTMNQLLTMAYISNRVRIMVDRYGKVVRPPRVG